MAIFIYRVVLYESKRRRKPIVQLELVICNCPATYLTRCQFSERQAGGRCYIAKYYVNDIPPKYILVCILVSLGKQKLIS